MPVTLHIGKEQNSTNLCCRTEGFNIHVHLDIGKSIHCKTYASFRKSTMFGGHYIFYTSGKADRKGFNFLWHSVIEKLPPAHSPPSSSP